MVSKACGQNLRVWDLANATEATKCPYLDVLNTHDTRAVFGSFAFGGDAQLSLVRLDLCRQLNRMELPLPSSSSSTAAASQQRSKRRALCSVKDVVGTHGSTGARGDAGSPVLVICSDGGVHCYEDGGAASATGRLVPVRSLTVEEDDDVAFTLAAVGAGRTPVVLQTRWNTQENAGEILVEPLRLGEGGKQAAVALRRKALAEVEEAGAVGSAGGGGKRHSTGVAVARCGGKQQQQDKENAAPLTGAAAAAGGADTGGEEGGAEAPTGGGKKGGGKRRAKSSPALLVVPPLVLEEGGGGPGRKSQSAPPTASPREVQQGGRPTPRGASAGRAAAAAAEALPDGLMACKPQPAPWRGAGGAGAVLPRGQEQAPYNPGKRCVRNTYMLVCICMCLCVLPVSLAGLVLGWCVPLCAYMRAHLPFPRPFLQEALRPLCRRALGQVLFPRRPLWQQRQPQAGEAPLVPRPLRGGRRGVGGRRAARDAGRGGAARGGGRRGQGGLLGVGWVGLGCHGWAVCMPLSINYRIIKRGVDAHPPAHAQTDGRLLQGAGGAAGGAPSPARGHGGGAEPPRRRLPLLHHLQSAGAAAAASERGPVLGGAARQAPAGARGAGAQVPGGARLVRCVGGVCVYVCVWSCVLRGLTIFFF